MRVRCKYCKTWFDTKDKYCPYCYARVRENDSVSMTDGRAKAAIFRHVDTHQEMNTRYRRETGRDARPCTSNKVNSSASTSANRPNNNGGHTSANTDRYVRTSSQNRQMNRNHSRKSSISQIVAWVIIIYVLIQVLVVVLSFLAF